MTTEHSATPHRGIDALMRRPLLVVVLCALASLAVSVGFALEARAATDTIDGTVGPRGTMTVAEGDTLRFDPNRDTTLIMTGNLIVRGTLIMEPANGNVEHVIEFRGNENNFVGGGLDPIPSDVGLWVMGSGRIILEGEDKPAWDYKWHSSWDGDEVRAAPNTPGNYDNFPQVTSTPAKNALGYPTELLNLSRNVVVRGTTSNYSHVFIRSSRPSSVENALFRYMAPDFGGDDATGRYGLHIHHSHDGSRGTIVDGLVIRDAKGHAFVPHMSHGITFRNVIAYNVRGEAFWWDEGDDSNDILYDHSVAALVRGANGGENHSLGAFNLGIGSNVGVTNSVVVGMQREEGAQRSGYIWPEDDEATWLFKNNIAHNNETNGIFVWQNNEDRHIIENFTAYYNGQSGIEHGAYTNSYVYNGLTLLENDNAIHSHANGERGDGGWVDTQIWAHVRTNGGTLVIDEHERDPERPVRFVECDLGRVVVNDGGGAQPSRYDFINCGLSPGDFDLGGARSDSVFRVQRADGSAFQINGNGNVSNIAKFYNGAPIPGSGSFGRFSDTFGHTHATAIEWLADQGITQGCNSAGTLFCPDDFVTRGQMAAFISRAQNLSAVDDDYFEDDDGTTFETAINRLATADITSGCNPPDNDEYCPDDFVTRGQMAAFLVRAFGFTDAGQGDYFDDDDESVFENAIDKLRVAGVTVGCNPPDNDEFCPNEDVTRGQMATFLRRALTG